MAGENYPSRPGCCLQGYADPKDAVAGIVSPRIVDLLEAIQVEEQQGGMLSYLASHPGTDERIEKADRDASSR